MKTVRILFLFGLALAATACGKREEQGKDTGSSLGGEYIKVTEGVTAIAGEVDKMLTFVIIPTDPGSVNFSNYSFVGSGHEWRGEIRFQNRKALSFIVKRDPSKKNGTAIIGDAEFELTKGEIFCVGSESGAKQIPGSNAGKKKDPGNASRLAEIYRAESRGQSGDGLRAASGESEAE